MIKLFITDLDGCVAHPFVSPDWEIITQIKELNRFSLSDPNIPALTICSGRPMPFTEAVAQWLDVRFPFLFESGGGLYDLTENKLTWNPLFNTEAQTAIVEIKEWLQNEIIKKYDGTILEFTKFTDAGLINPDPQKITLMYEPVLNHIAQNYPAFQVHRTGVSINVILKKTNKAEGIKFLCDVMELKLEEVAYIGDSDGDIPALEIVGKSFAPLNAIPAVKEKVGMVTKEVTQGVLEAYEQIIDDNRKESSGK